MRLNDLTGLRPGLSHLTLNLIVAVYVLAVLNAGFWLHLAQALPRDPAGLALFGLCILALTVFIFELLAPWRLQRPVLALLIVVAAAAAHFQGRFGIVIDPDMVRNIFETTPTESRHLIDAATVAGIGLTGVLPAALVFWPRVRRREALHQLWRWPLGAAVSLALVLGGLFLHFQAFSAMLRERHQIMASYQPGATLVSLARYARQELASTGTTLTPVGTDARPGPALAAAQRPVLLVVFVGETLRAQNWGLNGYARDTTPGLRARGVVNFPDMTACGTSTAVSVPCMLSDLTRDTYGRAAFTGRENLADVLAHAGFDVRWVDNNTGDQGVARRTGWAPVDPALDPAACDPECTDHILLPVIDQLLAGLTRNTVLFLHMIGNHGPAYYLRASADEHVFLPDCRTASFADCTLEEIVNAYDNAVLETDWVLSQAIDRLAAAQTAATALVFVSDHGESLGESGLFLHAAPSFMAPQVQTRVPMVIWQSDRFQRDLGLRPGCLVARAAAPTSHDNVFHTVLGLLDVATGARLAALDLTDGCREAGPTTALDPGAQPVTQQASGL